MGAIIEKPPGIGRAASSMLNKDAHQDGDPV